MKGVMAAFPRPCNAKSRAILAAIEKLRAEDRPIRNDTISALTGQTLHQTRTIVGRLRRIGELPCEVGKAPRSRLNGAEYLKVVAAADQLEREGGALTWDRIGRVAGCTAKAAHGHAQNADRAGLWRFTVLSKYSLMTKEERRELLGSTRPKPVNNGWTSEQEYAPMDLTVLAEIRATKEDVAREVEVRVCKYHSPQARYAR